jgi:hypothetical protein
VLFPSIYNSQIENVQKASISDRYSPSSEPFRVKLLAVSGTYAHYRVDRTAIWGRRIYAVTRVVRSIHFVASETKLAENWALFSLSLSAPVKSRTTEHEVIVFYKFTESFRPHLGPGICSSCNRNEYHRQIENFCRVDRQITPPSVSRLFRLCGIPNISQPCRPPWPVTGIALLFYM